MRGKAILMEVIMFAVIFELKVHPGKDTDYFAIAEELKSHLEHIDGFISIERFQSVADSHKFVSLSLWRDEAAITEWRQQTDHQAAQKRGQASIFSEYRLMVSEVIRENRFADGKRTQVDYKASGTG